jgi:heme exporter protein C
MNPKPLLLKILEVISVVLFVIAISMVFFYAPREISMGEVQRIFYFHVATAWMGMLGFLMAAISAAVYLATSKRKWDNLSLAAVEISVVFLIVAIISGSIWARPVWLVWWTWDIRLTTTTIMVLIYAAYLMLRQGIEDPDRRARFGAVYAILGFFSVPLTYFSIRFWRTIHPIVIGGGDPTVDGSFAMAPLMLHTLLFSVFAFSVIFFTLLWHRTRLSSLADEVEMLKLKMLR